VATKNLSTAERVKKMTQLDERKAELQALIAKEEERKACELYERVSVLFGDKFLVERAMGSKVVYIWTKDHKQCLMPVAGFQALGRLNTFLSIWGFPSDTEMEAMEIDYQVDMELGE